MKSLFAVFLVLTAATLPASQGTDPERKILIDNLNKSSAEFAQSISGLSAEQWNYKPAPEIWSIAECAEHITLSEDLLRDMVEKKVLAGPATPEKVAERKKLDGKVLKMITDRSFKAKAPEPLQPTRRFANATAVLQTFQESRSKTVALAGSSQDLRAHASPNPVLKELDAYQWLLYLSGHTMRHTAQIQEVKQSPGFPKAK